MALLSLCLRAKLNVIVCHVNYKKRKTADDEEVMVREYCEKHGIPCHILYPHKTDNSNFQMWAREARYEFYKDVYERENCDALLLGHQKDDHLENYLMALERGSHGWYYGIQRETRHHEMNIIRPLLDYRKAETRSYCEENNVPYHDDESNFTDDYQRNRIRHSLVEPASEEQISEWMKEIEEFNQKQKNKLLRFEETYESKELKISDFRNEENKEDLLRWFLWKHDGSMSFSSRQLTTITNNILDTDKNGYVELENDNVLAFEYGIMYVYDRQEDYEYVINELTCFSTPYFTLAANGRKIEQLTVDAEDFPLVIRNWKPDDTIELRFGHKKVSRFLIDRKIRRKDRETWPVVVNAKGEVIFVCGLGCDVRHFSINANMFVIK